MSEITVIEVLVETAPTVVEVVVQAGPTVVEVAIPGQQGPAGPQGEQGPPGAGAVDSVNGHTGTVVLAAGDIGYTPTGNVAATTVQGAINELDSEKASASAVTAALALKLDITAAREKLTANRIYFVRTDGSDGNGGLANTSGGAFLTKQKALDVILGTLDLGGFDVDVMVANGTYAGGITMIAPQVGKGTITFKGDTTTPSNVTTGVIDVDGAGCRLFFQGLNVSKGSGQFCVRARNNAVVRTTGHNQLSSSSGGHRFIAEKGGIVEAWANETVQGTVAGAHYFANTTGVIDTAGASSGGGSWTASGTAAQGLGFAYATSGGMVYAFNNTSSGTFTGPRYGATLNGVINTNLGGASYYPGNSAGSVATGGQYA